MSPSLSRRFLISLPALALGGGLPAPAFAAPSQDFAAWLDGVRREAIGSGLKQASVDGALKGVQPIPKVLELDRKQPERTLTFEEYIARSISQARKEAARQRLVENRVVLDEVSRRYKVQPRFIVALWGLETDFGRFMGGFSVIAALATLAYDGRRAEFFRRELINALKIVDRDRIDPKQMLGSWAGAMGQTQFMPSSYLSYAVSYSGDGKRDIWNRREDALASIANYLSHLGWHGDETWGRDVRVPPGLDPSLVGQPQKRPLSEWRRLGVRRLDGGELPAGDLSAALLQPSGPQGPSLLAYDNFRAIMKWNNSTYFAASVGYLADAME